MFHSSLPSPRSAWQTWTPGCVPGGVAEGRCLRPSALPRAQTALRVLGRGVFFALWFGVPFLHTDLNKRTFSFPTSPYHRDEHLNEEDTFSSSIPPIPCHASQNRDVATPCSYPPATVRGRRACEGLTGPWAPNPSILVTEDPRGLGMLACKHHLHVSPGGSRGSGLVPPLSRGRL